MPILHGVFTVTDDSGPRPVSVLNTSVIGIVGTAPQADAAEFPLNKPVLVAGSRRKAAKLDTTVDQTGGGTLLNALNAIFDQGGAMMVVVRVEEDADPATTLTNVIGTTDGSGVRSGMQAWLDAQSVLGVKPKILIAPGFTDDVSGAAALDVKCNELRAIGFIDAPGTTASEAVTYRANFDIPQAQLGWPALINGAGDVVPWSAYRAAQEAVKDNSLNPNDGYSGSASNRKLFNVIGMEYPVDFQQGRTDTTAALLNDNDISTVIRDDGFRTWGNRSLSADPKWQFLNHKKIDMVILDSIAEGIKWAVDRKITATLVDDLQETINAFLRQQARRNHIYGGECFIDPDLNPPEQIIAGQLYVNYDFTPIGIAEGITVASKFINDYAESIF